MSMDVVGNQKINCIKLLRQITGEGLKETKDFFEQEWFPFVIEGARFKPVTINQSVEDIMEMKTILERLDALETTVRQLTQHETKKMAANIFNAEGE